MGLCARGCTERVDESITEGPALIRWSSWSGWPPTPSPEGPGASPSVAPPPTCGDRQSRAGGTVPAASRSGCGCSPLMRCPAPTLPTVSRSAQISRTGCCTCRSWFAEVTICGRGRVLLISDRLRASRLGVYAGSRWVATRTSRSSSRPSGRSPTARSVLSAFVEGLCSVIRGGPSPGSEASWNGGMAEVSSKKAGRAIGGWNDPSGAARPRPLGAVAVAAGAARARGMAVHAQGSRRVAIGRGRSCRLNERVRSVDLSRTSRTIAG